MADFPQAQNLNPLLTGALRDPGKMQKDQVMEFLDQLQQERAAKQSETSGVGDLLNLLTARKAITPSIMMALDKLTGLDQSPFVGGMAVPSAVKQSRAALLKAALDAGKSGPRTPYHNFLEKQAKLHGNFSGAQPWQREYAATGKVPVVRVARDITPPSDRRLGAFYNVRTPTTMSKHNHYLTSGDSEIGGEVLYSGSVAPRNPYVRNALEGSPDQTMTKLLGIKEAEKISDVVHMSADKARPVLKKYGITEKELHHIWSSEEGPWARRDAVVAKILSSKGYDALVEAMPMGKSMYVPANAFGTTKDLPKGGINPEYSQKSGYNMTGPELFKFREPRTNLSFDPKASTPRGLDEVRYDASLSTGKPQSNLSPAIIQEFAAGRSPKLGKSSPQTARSSYASANPGTVTAGTTKIPPNWDKIDALAKAIGLTPNTSMPGLSSKAFAGGKQSLSVGAGPEGTSFMTSGKKDVFMYPGDIPAKVKSSKYHGLDVLHTELPGMVQFGNAADPAQMLSAIPGYSAKVYNQGKKLPKAEALQQLESLYKSLFSPKIGGPSEFDSEMYETILKSINQIKR